MHASVDLFPVIPSCRSRPCSDQRALHLDRSNPYPETPDRRYQAELEYQDTMPPRTFRQRNYPFSCQWWDIFPGRVEKLGMQAAQARTPRRSTFLWKNTEMQKTNHSPRAIVLVDIVAQTAQQLGSDQSFPG